MSETKAEGRGDDDQQGDDLRERERETNCERDRERETIYQRERDELRQRRKTHTERDDLRTDESRRKMKQRRTYSETTFRFFFTFFFLCLFFTNDPILDRIVFLSLQKRDSYTFLSKKCGIAFLTKIRHMVARFLHLRFHLVEVYDVTPFMDDHPGGDEVLLSATGKDATNDFEDVGHSDSAREMMEKYYIGEIDTSTVPLKRTFIPPQQTPYNPDKTPQFVIKILQFLVPIFILGLAFAVRSYTKEK